MHHPMQKLVVVAIDKDKASRVAVKWALDNLVGKGQTIVLVHVRVKEKTTQTTGLFALAQYHALGFAHTPVANESIENDSIMKDIFLPYRAFCSLKYAGCHEVVLEDTDVARAIIEYVKQSVIDILVLGAAAKNSFFRFKGKDIPSSVLKGVPEYCTVYVIHKGKISSTRAASRPMPSIISPLHSKLMSVANSRSFRMDASPHSANSRSPKSGNFRPGSNLSPLSGQNEANQVKSPFGGHRRASNGKSYDFSESETDLTFAGSDRRSVDIYSGFYDCADGGVTPPRLSGLSEFDYQCLDSCQQGRRSVDVGHRSVDLLSPLESPASDNELSCTGQSMDKVEAEMRRLKQELKQTMDMYSTACKEALSAKEKARELQQWKMVEEKRMEEARLAEESARALAEKEKMKSEATQRLTNSEAQKRIGAEMKSLKEAEAKSKSLSPLQQDYSYRKYTIDEIEIATEYFSSSRKIGEGGYGPVFKCYLDHTPVAVKVLRPDANQGREQFQQEVEILSCIRHPNMVLLLGACPEYGCLVYEYMSNGSLEDCLFRHGGKTPPLSWRHRFRIAAEISTGLHFLHQTKPEPLVHRDLKPANILLDRNYVSKISDVGLARLVPPSVADSLTQYLMTSAAGTLCYIDPEYQQTGMLGVKSDIYALGIIFLQILTAKPAMGISHVVGRAIEKGTFLDTLDPAVPDWPVEEALNFAKMGLKCAELRRKDRPDLGKVVLPFLNQLRELADKEMYQSAPFSPTTSAYQTQDELSNPSSLQSSTGG